MMRIHIQPNNHDVSVHIVFTKQVLVRTRDGN